MPSIRKRPVVLMTAIGAAFLALAIFFPSFQSTWIEARDRRAENRNFVGAAESDQRAIVRAYLTAELQVSPPCDPAGLCFEVPVYFDHLPALLRSLDSTEPWDEYEARTDRPADGLINRSNVLFPIPLQELLDQLVQQNFYNVDPALAGVIFVPDIKSRPLLSCTEFVHPRLVRISRAAIQRSEDIAIALVTRTYCDESTLRSIAEFRRDANGWNLMEDYLGGL